MAEAEYKRRSTDNSILYGIKDWWSVIFSVGVLIGAAYITREDVQDVKARTGKLETVVIEHEGRIIRIEEALKALPEIKEYVKDMASYLRGNHHGSR